MSKKLLFQNLTKKIEAQERTLKKKSVVQKMKNNKNWDVVCAACEHPV